MMDDIDGSDLDAFIPKEVDAGQDGEEAEQAPRRLHGGAQHEFLKFVLRLEHSGRIDEYDLDTGL